MQLQEIKTVQKLIIVFVTEAVKSLPPHLFFETPSQLFPPPPLYTPWENKCQLCLQKYLNESVEIFKSIEKNDIKIKVLQSLKKQV